MLDCKDIFVVRVTELARVYVELSLIFRRRVSAGSNFIYHDLSILFSTWRG